MIELLQVIIWRAWGALHLCYIDYPSPLGGWSESDTLKRGRRVEDGWQCRHGSLGREAWLDSTHYTSFCPSVSLSVCPPLCVCVASVSSHDARATPRRAQRSACHIKCTPITQCITISIYSTMRREFNSMSLVLLRSLAKLHL